MAYLIGQILLCLLVAALVGGVVGWLLRGLGQRARQEAQAAEWATRLRVAEGETHEVRRARDELARRVDERDAALAQFDSKLASARADLKAQAANVAALQSEAEALTTKAAEFQAANDATARESDRLRSELDGKVALIARLESESKAATARSSELHGKLESSTSESSRLRSELKAVRQAHEHCDERIATLNSRVREVEEQLRRKQAEAASAARSAGRPNWLLSEAPREKDDLKRIWGVGPVLERTMNSLGIYHYRQIAGWSRPDVEWVATQLGAFPDRIERDGWVEQAGRLQAEKYGHRA